MAEISVGIDLGTTNSCISTCWPNGQPRLLRDENGVGVIPSVVSFGEDGRIEVGHKAKMRILNDPLNTFNSVKRFIGRDMRLDESRWACSMYPYTIEAGENGIATAVTRGARYPVFQISGYVLRHLKEMAERSLEREVSKAVITVPANFNEVQRRATYQAGEFAGFEVLRIFNEPTAAALAYGLGKESEQVVAVFDFGGGTFDITILRLQDPVFEVIATSGDMLLGGDDFDRRLLEDMLEQFKSEYGFNPEGDLSLRQRLMLGAERMKCQLTDWIVTAFEDRHVRRPDGQSLPPFHYELNRDRFRTLTSRFVDRSFEACDEAFKLAGMKPAEISDVILVGGTTRIPYLRDRVKQYFGKPPLDKIQPDVVVSIGASIQSYALTGGDFIYPATARDMLPIRKVEARPPVPKLMKPGDSEFLDDFSDHLETDEAEALKSFKKAGRTMQGIPRLRTPAPMPSPVIASPHGAHADDSPLPPVVSTGKGARREPKPGTFDLIDEPDISAQTLVAAGGAPPTTASFARGPSDPKRPVSALDTDLPAPWHPEHDSQQQELEADPFSEASAPAPSPEFQVSVPGPHPAAMAPSPQPPPDFAQTLRQPLPPSAARVSRPPSASLPRLASKPPSRPLQTLPQQVTAPLAPPRSSSLDDLLESESRSVPDAAGGTAEARSIEAPMFSFETPTSSPLVTPESAAKPFVSRDVIEEMRRVEAQDTLIAAGGGVAQPGPAVQPSRAPLLLDVTANTLGVATVGGFVEVLVGKNSPVPIEKRHIFTTSAHDQDRAVIRVLEGESSKASENHVLGEVELQEIRKAPRGAIKIEVCYEINVDGILKVSARNLETGEAQTSRLTLFGG